ncbi:hypothetical protein EAH78_02390 [Pseudomonas arsenicoxydans]|uniref:Uncharacterized protein n=1 Tax=Pseudomonas arsenicoxydans TaxID=702115 RepID=A0A502I8W5_9PSED|nr:hypothetical protein EAH78_02390 [Pseudomonas arsenicoxydans]
MTVWRRVGYRDVNITQGCGEAEDAFASKPAPTFEIHSNVGAGLLAIKVGTTLRRRQSSSAFTDLGDSRKLRRLRLTLLR